MGFDRGKYKSTSLDTLKEQEKAQKELRPNRGGEKTEYLSFDEGDNIIRLFPFHPEGGGSSFAESRTQSFLTVPTEYKDGKKTDKVEWKRRPVFNAKVHGVDAEGNALKYDLVESYLDILKKQLKEEYADDDKAFGKKWFIATGFSETKQTSIKPSDNWVMYANKKGEGFGLLPVGVSVKDGINSIAAQNEGEDDMVNLDPFSDPDTGLAFVVTKKKGTKENPVKPADIYRVKFHETRKAKAGGGFTTDVSPDPLTDEALQAFSEKKSLYELFRGAYTEKDFQLQIEGLQRFEEDHGFDLFETDEFREVLNYLADNVQPDPEKEEESSDEDSDDNSPLDDSNTESEDIVTSTETDVAEEPKAEPAVEKKSKPKAKVKDSSKTISNGINKKRTLAEIRASMGK